MNYYGVVIPVFLEILYAYVFILKFQVLTYKLVWAVSKEIWNIISLEHSPVLEQKWTTFTIQLN